MDCAHIHIITIRTSEFESTGESANSSAQAAPAASISVQNNEVDVHLDSDTSQDTSHETTPSGSKASGEFENENEDDFWDREYGPVGPVDDTTESPHLSSLAALGVQIEEHIITHLQPLQGDQPAHHPL